MPRTSQKEIEVLFNEIYIPILEMRHATLRQKSSLLSTYLRLCQDPQALVDIYINYDCDRSSVENIYERLVNVIGRLGQAHFPLQSKAEEGSTDSKLATFMSAQTAQLASISPVGDSKITARYAGFGSEQRVRRQALDGVIAILRSLVEWTNIMRPPQVEDNVESGDKAMRPSHSDHRLSVASVGAFGLSDSQIKDDPERFASARQQKTSLMEGIRDFNFKPKRVSGMLRSLILWRCLHYVRLSQGIQYMLQHGFIADERPESIAHFLLHTEGLSKAQIGEYLGDGCVHACFRCAMPSLSFSCVYQ